MALLAFCLCISIFGNVLAATVEKTVRTDKPQTLRGPRDDLNETGRFLFPHPHILGESVLCKNCSRRALYNGQYSNEQEIVCINKNFQKLEPYNGLKLKIYPYCKIGTDFVCGEPSFNSNNSYLVCYPGYSPTKYSVYSTCQLICNSSGTVIRQIYCSELLSWHVDQYATEECLEPVVTVPPNRVPAGSPGSTDTIVIPVVCGAVIAVLLIGVLICLCYRRNKRLSRPPSADIVENAPEEIPLTNQHPLTETDVGNSIGDCSLDYCVGEDSQLLNRPQAVNMSTSTSMLDTCGQNTGQIAGGQDLAGHQTGQSGFGVSNRSASSQTDDDYQDCHARLGASCTSSSSHTDNEQSGQQSGQESGQPGPSSSEQSRQQSDQQSGERNGQSGPSSTDRSESTNTDSDHHEQETEIPNTQIRCGDSSVDEQKGHKDESYIRLPRLGSSSRTGSSSTDGEQNRQENQDQCPIQNGQEIGQSYCGQENGLRSSGRSNSSQNDNEPYLEIFTPETVSRSRCGSGTNRLQENAYSVQIDSSIYFVPSQTTVKEVKIVRKGEGPPFGGILWISPNNYAIDKVTADDEGLYMYIITWEQDGETKTKEGSFELFVGNKDIPFNNRDAGEPCGSPQKECQQSQRSTVVKQNTARGQNGAERSHGTHQDLSGNAAASGRLPPEGAENEAPQASGQGHPKFNGARPKTKLNFSPTVVSGASVGGVKDPQPMRNTLSNNLDISKIPGGDEELKVDNFNISADLPSVEDNNKQTDESLSEDLKVEDTQGSLTSEHLNFNSLLSSEVNPSVSQQNDLNNCELQSNSENVSDNSVEFTSVELEKLKPNEPKLDFSEILDSDAGHNLQNNSSNIQTSVRNGPQMSDGPRSLSHLDPATLNEGITQHGHLDLSGVHITRPDPSGRSDQPQTIELNRHETEPKVIYRRNEGVRGEQTAEDSSVFNKPDARVRLTSTDITNIGQRHEGHDPDLVDRNQSDRGHVGEARRELNESVQGAEGGAPIVAGMHQQQRADILGTAQCITALQDLKDLKCLQNVYWYANPRDKYPDAKTWFGLCSYFEYPLHQLEAIDSSLKSDHNNGPMYHALTCLLSEKNLRIGDVVYYYTLESSYRPDIVEHLVYKCENHKNCEYCLELSRRARLKYQLH